MSKTPIDPERWQKLLLRVDAHLVDDVRVCVIGGAAMALAYGGRRSTDDFDAWVETQEQEELLRRAAVIVAREESLPEDWFNFKAKERGFVTKADADDSREVPLNSAKHLKVVVPRAERMLAKKLRAHRTDIDKDDAVLLIKQLLPSYGGDPEALWNVVGGLAPDGTVRHLMKDYFEAYLEEVEVNRS